MDSLQIAFYVVVILILIALIILFAHLIIKRSNELKQEVIEVQQKPGKPNITFTYHEPISEETQKFWEIERQKERNRHSVFASFGKPDCKAHYEKNTPIQIKKKHHDHYKKRMQEKKPDIAVSLDRLRLIHKYSPLSRLRKLSKKPSDDFLDLLKGPRKDEEKRKEHSLGLLKEVTNTPDKKHRIIEKLKKLHR